MVLLSFGKHCGRNQIRDACLCVCVDILILQSKGQECFMSYVPDRTITFLLGVRVANLKKKLVA